VNVCGQIFRRIEQPQELLPAHARSRFTGPIPWGDLFACNRPRPSPSPSGRG
jgi:hypothetical protein